jgi:hypothetical protein
MPGFHISLPVILSIYRFNLAQGRGLNPGVQVVNVIVIDMVVYTGCVIIAIYTLETGAASIRQR